MKKIIFILLLIPCFASAQFVANRTLIGNIYGSPTAFDTTGIYQNLAVSSATAGWQSDTINNQIILANDYEIFVSLQMKFGTPANDKAVYIDICPWFKSTSTLLATDQGTVTLPTGAHGATTIASPNNLVRAAVINCATSKLLIRKSFSLKQVLGYVPDGFSLIITNFSGLADSTINIVKYTPLN